MVGWLALLLYVLEVLGSNLGLGTSYPNRFSWFSSVSPGKYWDNVFKLGHDHFLPHPLQFIIQ
jgi:hypothetical protein